MKLKCNICGNTDMIKNGDFIICQGCGCKYPVEKFQKIFLNETPAPVVPAEEEKSNSQEKEPQKRSNKPAIIALFFIFSIFLTIICFTQPLPEIRENGYVFKMKDDGTYMVHSYTKNESEITVPSSVRGRAVTEIGGMAFKDNHNIKTLIIPEGITTIGSAAFLNCNSIETLVVPFLGKNTGSAGYLNYFFNSSIGKRLDGTSVPDSLKNVYLLDTCTQLGDCAFIQCKHLKKVYIPSSVKIIDDGTGGTVIGVNGNTSTYYDKFPFYGCSEDLTIYCESYSKDTQWDEYWNYINYAYSLEVHWGSKLYSSPYYVSDGYYVSEAIDHSIPQTVALNMSNYKTYLNLAYKVTPQNYTNNVFNPGYHELKVEINVENASDDLTFQDVELTVYFEVTYKEKELKSVYTKTTSQTRAKTFTIKIGNNGRATAKTAFYTSDNGVIEDISSTICELHDITGTVTFYP